jgi:hypothetical protein
MLAADCSLRGSLDDRRTGRAHAALRWLLIEPERSRMNAISVRTLFMEIMG